MSRVKKFFLGFVGVVLLAGVVWWVGSAPPSYIVIAPPYVAGDVPASVLAVRVEGDPIADTVEVIAPEIRGYDDLVIQEDLGRAFVTSLDGWIWKVDLKTGTGERFVDTPLMAAGIEQIAEDEDSLCFCASFLHGVTYPAEEQVGLYRLDIPTGEITLLVSRVPLPPAIASPQAGNDGTVFTAETENRLTLDEMDDTNSRALAFCNDVDVSSDGKRFYFSEPFPYEGASMMGGAVPEAISMGNNGRLWNYDSETNSVALVAQDYNFIDGVLLEDGEDGRETSVLVTEATKFRILRFHLNGEEAGKDEVVWSALPGLPDAIHRDAEGRIWLGLIKQRSGLLTWAHANPWIKPLMLRLPLALLPVPEVTGVMVFSADGSEVLWFSEHAGTHVRDISSVNPSASGVYLGNARSDIPGLLFIPNPLDGE